MSDTAYLNIGVDSTDSDKAAKSLDNLADFAEKAEKATDALGQAVQKNAKEYKSLADMADDLAKSERRAVEQIHQRAKAYTKSAGAEVAAMRATEKSAQSMSQYAAETEKLRAGLTKLLTAIDPLEARLNKLDDAEEKLTQTFKRGIIDAEKYAESLAKIGAQRNDIAEKQLKEIGDGAEYAAGMMEKLGLGTRLAQQDLMNLGRAAAQGDLKQVQNSIFQLTRNTGALSLALSGAGAAAGVAVGSIALLGTAYYQSYQRTQEFNRSVAFTGNALSTSAAEMTRMTAEVGRLSGSYAQAEQAANLIVRSGRIASDSIQDVMKTAVEMQQAFGQSVDQTISEFDRLGESPSQTLLELNEKYRFLTAAVYEQVRALEDQGREEEAAKLAQAELSKALEDRSTEVIANVGSMERAWLSLKGVVSETWQAILNVGTVQTDAMNLASVEARLASIKKELSEIDSAKDKTFGDSPTGPLDVLGAVGVGARKATAEAQREVLVEEQKNLEAERDYLQGVVDTQDWVKELQAEDKRINEEGIRLADERRKYVKTYTKSTLASELAKANEELKQVTAGLDKESAEYAKVMEAHYNRVEQINKKYEKSTRSGGASGNQFAAEVARLKARIAEERDLSKAVEETITQVTRLNQFERKAMQLREQASKETKAGTKAQLEKLAALNEEAGALVRNNKLAEEAAKERLKYLEGLEKSTKSTYDEAQKLRDQAQTMGMSRMALEALTTARIEEQIAQLKGKEGSEEEIKLLREQIAARHELTDAIGQREMAQASYEAQQELERDWQRTVDNIDDVFRRGFADMLNEGKGSWNSFTKSLTTTFKTAVADQIYKMFMKPFVAQVAVGLTGGLGMGGASAGQQNVAAGFDVLRTANTAYSAFTGGLTSSLSKGIGYLGEQLGSSALSSFSAGMTGTLASSIGAVAPSAAASLGTSLTGTAMANTAFSSGITGSGLSGAFGAGAGLATAMPWITGGLAIASLLPSLFGKGETRSGGGFIRQNEETKFMGGPSGGYGGAMQAVDQVLAAATASVDGLFEALDIDGRVDYFQGSFESSKKGRGGTQSGGAITLGDEYLRFGVRGKGSGYGGTSGSAEEMFDSMVKDMSFSVLEAWQLAADQMPAIIGDMLDGIDIRALSAEQAEAMVGQISGTVQAVNTLRVALDDLPFENLRDLSFDAAAGLMEMAGGTEALLNSMNAYYENFYSEAERQEQSLEQMVKALGGLDVVLPASRESFRELAESIDVSSDAGQELYATLMSMSGAAAGYYSYLEEQSSEAFESIAADINQSRDEYLSALQEQHSARMQAVRDEYQAQVSAVRDQYTQQTSSFRAAMTEINEKMRELEGVVRTLGSGISALREQSDIAAIVYRNASKTVIDEALKLGRAGKSLVGFDGLNEAIASVSKLDKQDFASQFDFELERAESINALKELGGLTGDQIDVQQLQVNVLEKQLEQLEKWRDAQLEELEKTRTLQLEQLEKQFEEEQANAKAQFDLLLKTEQAQFEAEMAELMNSQINQMLINDSINAGAANTTRGLSSVESAVNASASRIASAISNIRISVTMPSPSSGKSAIPGFASGGRYPGGMAWVGEEGPELINFAQPAMVYTAAQSKNLMANAGAGNDEVAMLLRQLLAEIKEMRHETRQVVINTQKILGLVDDATESSLSDESIIVTY